VNCETCAADVQPSAQEAKWLEALAGEAWRGKRLRRGKGCPHCNRTGYVGRTGVYEMLEMTPELVRAANVADPNAFLDAARTQLKGQTLTDSALELVFSGRTTVAEAMKVAVELED
jgi:MSHA biogenesis protein MshE